MYVETVVGRDTVNTMPPAHARRAARSRQDRARYRRERSRRGARRRDARAAGREDLALRRHAQAPSRRRLALLRFLRRAARRDRLQAEATRLGGAERVRLSLGACASRLRRARSRSWPSRFPQAHVGARSDALVGDPAAAPIIKKSLGLARHSSSICSKTVPELQVVRRRDAGRLSTPPSSAAWAAVRSRPTFSPTPSARSTVIRELHVLDSTYPQQIKELEDRSIIARTLFIISSKSGTTTEPNAFYAYFHEKVSKASAPPTPARNFVAITDPGTPLVEEAKEESFRAYFENDPNIGGRYSALSFVGIVPSAIAGYDINLLLDRALGAMHANDAPSIRAARPAFASARRSAALRVNGRDKLTIVTHPRRARFRRVGRTADRGIDRQARQGHRSDRRRAARRAAGLRRRSALRLRRRELCRTPSRRRREASGTRRRPAIRCIRLAMNDQYDLGEQFYLWEIAVAAAGVILGIDAFDQPNVQESKDNTVRCSRSTRRTARFDEPKPTSQRRVRRDAIFPAASDFARRSRGRRLPELLRSCGRRLQRDHGLHRAQPDRTRGFCDELRLKIRNAHRVATTVGFGPRFLHSTGQLHKGGPDTCVVICRSPSTIPTIR